MKDDVLLYQAQEETQLKTLYDYITNFNIYEM